MYGMGVMYESADSKFLLGFLQRCQGLIGIVVTGLDDLLRGREDESRFLDYLESLVDAGGTLQVVLITNKELKETRASMVHYTLESFSESACEEWTAMRLQKHTDDKSVLKGILHGVQHPLCLDLVISSITMGEAVVQDLAQVLANDCLDSLADQISAEHVAVLEKKERKCGLPIYVSFVMSLKVFVDVSVGFGCGFAAFCVHTVSLSRTFYGRACISLVAEQWHDILCSAMQSAAIAESKNPGTQSSLQHLLLPYSD